MNGPSVRVDPVSRVGSATLKVFARTRATPGGTPDSPPPREAVRR